MLGSMDRFHTIIEPFRIHSVEPLRLSTAGERQAALEAAGWNLFNVHADDVLIDLLTDSGTGAMSRDQWAGIQRGDESYAGSPSWFTFLAAVQELFPFRHVIPTHQGRAAEKILFSVLGGPGRAIPNNTHFDTTRANVEYTGAEAVDLVIPEGRIPAAIHPFKGNMDVGRARAVPGRAGRRRAGRVRDDHQQLGRRAAGVASRTCGRSGPCATGTACRSSSTPAASPRTPGSSMSAKPARRGRPVADIVREIASLADGMTMSAKKDGLANIGGWLAMNDDSLAERCRNLLILTEGFPTYGGLAGRDLEAIAQGLREVVDEDYLRYRITLDGIPRRRPRPRPACRSCSRSAVTPSTSTRARCCPTSQPLEYPGQALAVALYREGGIRGCEIGTVMFGRQPDGSEAPASMDLVRLAIPRRTYTQSHIDYVIEVVRWVADRAPELRGLRIVDEPPVLRHFTARFAPL